MNTFGDKFAFTSFGESHSTAVGGVLDGVPAGITIDLDLIRSELLRRAGHGSPLPSPRAVAEPDEVEWLSGVMDGKTLGTPIAFIIRNAHARPEDYEIFRHHCRPAHADKVYELKYGLRDHRGGGRASARETASRVVAGTVAKQLLAEQGIRIEAHVTQVGTTTDPTLFEAEVRNAAAQGDSVGGIITCTVKGLPVGVGEPIFDKLQSHLAFAMLSINGCKGFDYGSGFAGVTQMGEQANQVSGGISGGISDGTDLQFRVVFRPTPTTPKSVAKMGIDLKQTRLRMDACIVFRAVPVVEAMTALTLRNMQG